MKYKLAFFTSTRSDMTILEPLLNEIKSRILNICCLYMELI